MSANANLHRAKDKKNDEFYTQLPDIENELKHYREHFKDKVVFCNCDDPEWSNFWQFFSLQFEFLGLKKLIATHFEDEKQSYKLEMWRDEAGVHSGIKTLQQNGDFRSPESIELLKEADIVVTNPPFSLFREYIAQLMEYDKKFLIIGNKNAITYKEFFPLLKDNKVWIGYNNPSEFGTPSGITKKMNGLTRWFTNLDIKKRHEELVLYKKYTPAEYPKYDNYDAINVDKVSDIPIDYDGVMGVPITFLDKYNPEQFEIMGITLGTTVDYSMTTIYENATQHNQNGSTQGGGKVNTRAAVLVKEKPAKVYYTADNVDGYLISIYPRILIKKKTAMKIEPKNLKPLSVKYAKE